MNKLFYNIYKWFAAQKLLGIGVLLALCIGLFFLASNIKFEEDITKLIPVNNKNAEAQKVLNTVNFADKIIINIKLDSLGSLDHLTQYATQFIDSITKSSGKYIQNIQGQVAEEDIQETIEYVYKNLPLFLEDKDYQEISNKLERDSINAITKNNYKTLISPSGFIAKETILKDPLGITFIALKKLQSLSLGDTFNIHNGFLVSKNKKHLLLFITPNLKSSETQENAAFAENINTLILKLNNTFKTKVQSESFGGVLVAVANAKQIKKDIQLTVGFAISILLLILIWFYKKISIPVILFVPTLFGGLLAVAILYLVREKISAISLGIGSVLLGVTLDYSLHILTHIRSNNNVKNLYSEITKPILMSSLTTALAFLCLLFLKSQALQDLGLFAAISVIGASVFALVFIPQVYTKTVTNNSKNTIIDKLAKIPFHKKKAVLLTIVFFLFASIFTYNKVAFNTDITKLNYQTQALIDAQNRLDLLTNTASKSVYIAAYGTTEKEVLQANDEIFSTLQKLENKGEIIDFSSIGSIVHSKESQNKRIAKWEAFWSKQKINNTKNNLIESGKELGFKASSFTGFYNLLETEFKPLTLADYKELKTIALKDFIATNKGFTTATTLVKVEAEQASKIVDLFNNKPQILVIDRQQMNETFLGNLKTDFNKLVRYSLLVVVVLLLLFYRSVSLTLVTCIPIALTWFLTLGIMGFAGISFNIFNIIICSFIFGLGVDYSIFITNGLLHNYRTGENALPTYKTSIILSVITTILGVGVLIFAKHPALYSISLVSIVGIVSAIIISFSLQPLLFKLFIGSKTGKPSPFLNLFFSIISFTYYGLGGLVLSILGMTILKIIPISAKKKMSAYHKVMSKFMHSVLISFPFFKTKVINLNNETFKKQAVIIANHTSFLDILTIGMLHPKIIFLVNDWVYNSPFFGKAVQLAGFYPVSSGIENGMSHLQKKVDQGYSLMAFPEGTRSYTNKIKRFHKGAFHLADTFNLDIIPVLIHGNSEVLPKGNFVIKKGIITIKILERIPAGTKKYGDTTRAKTKQVSTYFKSQFNSLRNELEGETYFHKLVLESYRYKGDNLYKKVQQNLAENKTNYKNIIDFVGEKDTIINISKASGELDLLLALDRPNRKTHTLIENKDTRKIIANNYLKNTHYSISCLETIDSATKIKANTLIVNSNTISEEIIKAILENGITKCIVLNDTNNLQATFIKNQYFQATNKSINLTLLTKK
ncbi:MAG: 1-acyl-sn-glycerol-3-phosphate acyltransferase [Oceanihabitans sp.]